MRVLDDLGQLHDQVTGSMQLSLRPVVLSDWLAQALAPWHEVAYAKGLAWHVRIPPELPVIEADPDRLGQALGNLLSNAVKFTPSGGQITIEAWTEAESV